MFGKKRMTDNGIQCESHFIFLAVISQLYHPEELALARLSEAFGPAPAKYIDFQLENTSTKMTSSLTMLMSFFLAILLL